MRSLIHTMWRCFRTLPEADYVTSGSDRLSIFSAFYVILKIPLQYFWIYPCIGCSRKREIRCQFWQKKFSKCSRLDLDKCNSAFSDQAPVFIDSGHDRHVLVPVFWLCANHICRISWTPLSAGILNYIIRRLKSDTNFHGIWISKFSAHRSTRELMAPWLTLKKLFLTL